MLMQYITWNTWHGCHKKSEGCKNCYVFTGDKAYNLDPEAVRLVKTKFKFPLMKTRSKEWKLPLNSHVGVCLTSDFFIKEGDQWRAEAWQMMRLRPDCTFFIITKRPERIIECLPADWGEGYPNVILSTTVENMARVEERLPIFLKVPCQRKTLTVAPILEEITLDKYLATGQILGVSAGGESDEEQPRLSKFDWYLRLHNECLKYKVDFEVYSLGNRFEKDGKIYTIPRSQSFIQAEKSNLSLNFNNMYKQGKNSFLK